jgi:uncharacterized protein YuzE
MRWTFDVDAGALYAHLGQGHSARQAEISDGVVVDFAANGTVLGVEFLSPCPPIPRDQLEELGVSPASLTILDYLVHTPLPRRVHGILMSTGGHVRSDQAIEPTLDVRAEPIPA